MWAPSVFGTKFGVGALPARWVDPLNDRIRTTVADFDNSRESDLVNRTMALVQHRGE